MIWFCLAAGMGAVLRYLADFYLPRRGIIFVNTVGSFLAGVAFGVFQGLEVSPAVQQLVLGGFLGSLTTYATVALYAAEQRVEHSRSGARPWVIQVGLSLAACSCGLLAAVMLLG